MSRLPDAKRRALIGAVPILKTLAPGEIDALTAFAIERRFARGESLMRAGDPGSSMMVVVSGELRVQLSGADGSDRTIGMLGPGAVVGELALFDGGPRSADVVATTNGSLLAIERAPVRALIEAHPDLAFRVIGILCERLRRTNAQLDRMLFFDVGARLASCLLELARSGTPRRRVDRTQSELAQMVGASREIVNKRLRALAEAGVVALTPGRVTLLDEARLAAAAARRE